MPLPKPPARKAALLAPADYESQAAPKPARRDNPKSSSNTETESGPGVLDLFDSSQAEAAAPLRPVAALPTRQLAPQPKPRKPRGTGPAKLFVLDTNVLMHDPTCLFRFEEHDVYLPMITLEELDGHKKGMSEVSRNVRQVSRELDALAAQGFADPK
jgi:PhoH-like ATPase